MSLNRIQIKQNAKDAFTANYWPMVGILFLSSLITLGCSALGFTGVGAVASIILSPVLVAGCCYVALKNYRAQITNVEDLFEGFKVFGHTLGGMLWMGLFTFLWSLLFLIPGIIKSFSYFATPYILLDMPEIKATDALKLSMEMTKGHKGEIFVMYLSFIGWALLASITCGIVGIFYVYPYIQVTCAGFYDEMKNQYYSANYSQNTTYSQDPFSTDNTYQN